MAALALRSLRASNAFRRVYSTTPIIRGRNDKTAAKPKAELNAALRAAANGGSLSRRPSILEDTEQQRIDKRMSESEKVDVKWNQHSGIELFDGSDSELGADIDGFLPDAFEDDDTSTPGHMLIQAEREALHYFRIIEHEIPKLTAYRQEFVPPTRETPVVIRSVRYSEDHPTSLKRVVTCSVDDLPLKDDSARHRIKLLAGPRWSPRPHNDGGACSMDQWKNGYIKISCEDYATGEENYHWASKILDKLVEQANEPGTDKLDTIPVDLRHIFSKARKARRGEHIRGRLQHRATLHDFPQDWLPEVQSARPIIQPEIA